MFGRKMLGYRRRTGSYSYRRPYKRSRWGSTYSKAVGAAKAAKIGNKISYYNAQVSGYVNFSFASGSFTSDVHTFQPYTNATTITGSGATTQYTYYEDQYRHGAATFDKGFRLKCAMNDEVRLCRMTVRLQPATSIPNNAALRVYSIVDRNLTYDEYMNMTGGATHMDDNVTAKDIMENQGALVQTFNSNRIAPLSRMSRPTDIKENTSWTDASIYYNSIVNESPLKEMSLTGWYTNKTDYCPAFHYACQSSIAAASDSTFTFGYTVEYTFAFRNPKSGLDLFIKQEAIGYVNPAAKAGNQKTLTTTPTKTEKEEETETEKEEETETLEEDHDPGTS